MIYFKIYDQLPNSVFLIAALCIFILPKTLSMKNLLFLKNGTFATTLVVNGIFAWFIQEDSVLYHLHKAIPGLCFNI